MVNEKKNRLNHTTTKGLKNSILTDYHVYRWFLFLFSQERFYQRIKDDISLRDDYLKIKRLAFGQMILNVFALFVGIFLFFFSKIILIFFALFIFSVHILLFSKKKYYLSEVGGYFFIKDFSSQGASEMTLYQIGEIYSKKYKILSLVDAIYHLERLYKMAFLFSFLLVGYILYLDVWLYRVILFVGLYFFIFFILNASFIYKHFDK